MKRATPKLALCLAALLFWGCEDTEAPVFPTITGSWAGTTDDVTLSMAVFEDEAGNVDGSGTLSSPSVSFPLQITGGHVFPTVQLQMALTTEPDVLALEGFVAFDSVGGLLELDAALTGGGFDQFPILLERR